MFNLSYALEIKKIPKNFKPKDSLIEREVEYKNIGRKGFNKIIISRYQKDNNCYVIIQFYSKTKKWWKLKNTYSFEQDLSQNLNPEIADFNNDGFLDITYNTFRAARGANDVRRLCIYDKIKNELICMKEDNPNLQYNKELKCITSCAVHGGYTFYFLKIVGNQLNPFIRVDGYTQDNGKQLTLINKNGKERVIPKKEHYKWTKYLDVAEF